jgi:polyferredoxin
MSKNRGDTDAAVRRDREYWFVAILFWLVIAPIFLYGFAKASTMPAELLITWLNPSSEIAIFVDILFLVLSLAFSIFLILDVWKRLKIGLADRAA